MNYRYDRTSVVGETKDEEFCNRDATFFGWCRKFPPEIHKENNCSLVLCKKKYYMMSDILHCYRNHPGRRFWSFYLQNMNFSSQFVENLSCVSKKISTW